MSEDIFDFIDRWMPRLVRGAVYMLAAMPVLLVAAIVMALLTGCRTDMGEANRAAAEYVKKIPHSVGWECANIDSDGNGYVACTVFRAEGEPLAIECGSERFCIWNCARGCKYLPFAGSKRGSL